MRMRFGNLYFYQVGFFTTERHLGRQTDLHHLFTFYSSKHRDNTKKRLKRHHEKISESQSAL